MCVAAIAWQAHPRWRLIAIGNRDEAHVRPAAPLAQWTDGSGIIAGCDLQAGGTWLGVRGTRFALVTNYRIGGHPRSELASRGALVTAWLRDHQSADPNLINPFHLLRADAENAWLDSNWPEPQSLPLTPGIHGVSNGPLQPMWPKTRTLCDALLGWAESDEADPDPLLTALGDTTPRPAPDISEAPCSAIFVRNERYGTRCSTVVLLDHHGAGRIIERRFDSLGNTTGQSEIALLADSAD